MLLISSPPQCDNGCVPDIPDGACILLKSLWAICQHYSPAEGLGMGLGKSMVKQTELLLTSVMVAEDLEIIWYVILYAMQTILALMVVLRNKYILYEDIIKCDIDLNGWVLKDHSSEIMPWMGIHIP